MQRKGVWGRGGLPPSCGTDRHCHCENKHACWGCRPVCLVPGLSPCPLILQCLWSLCCCLATGSIFLSSGGTSGCGCHGLIYRRKSPVWGSGRSQPKVFISIPRLLVAWGLGWGFASVIITLGGAWSFIFQGDTPYRNPRRLPSWSFSLQPTGYRSCLPRTFSIPLGPLAPEMLFLGFFLGAWGVGLGMKINFFFFSFIKVAFLYASVPYWDQPWL